MTPGTHLRLSTGRRLGVLFSYDERLCIAAAAAGVPVERPE